MKIKFIYLIFLVIMFLPVKTVAEGKFDFTGSIQITPYSYLINSDMKNAFNNYFFGPQRIAMGFKSLTVKIDIGFNYFTGKGSEKIEYINSFERFIEIYGSDFSVSFLGENFYGGMGFFSGVSNIKVRIEYYGEEDPWEKIFKRDASGARIFFGSNLKPLSENIFFECFAYLLDITNERGKYSDEDGDFNNLGITLGFMF